MKRRLIVNADDCNLTPGVTRAILDCHDRGILTSTTFMVNLPVESLTVRELRARRQLGVGIHLNVTFAAPVSKPAQIRSLVDAAGMFRRDYRTAAFDRDVPLPRAADLLREYQAQIRLFKKLFGRLPTHLDTHHQLHDHPFFLRVLLDAAQFWKLPVRRSVIFTRKQTKIKTADFLFGDLRAEKYWRKALLCRLLAHLPQGTSEIMCHPGRVDRDLRKVTSFLRGREAEWRIFSAPALRRLMQKNEILPVHYGML